MELYPWLLGSSGSGRNQRPLPTPGRQRGPSGFQSKRLRKWSRRRGASVSRTLGFPIKSMSRVKGHGGSRVEDAEGIGLDGESAASRQDQVSLDVENGWRSRCANAPRATRTSPSPWSSPPGRFDAAAGPEHAAMGRPCSAESQRHAMLQPLRTDRRSRKRGADWGRERTSLCPALSCAQEE